MEFITPIPHSYPGNVVLTDDMGIIESEPCPYGRPGQRFRITGRMKKAEVRGCGDILSAKLTFNAKKSEAVVDDKNLDVQYFKGSLEGDNTEKQFQSLIDQLNAQNDWIRQQPVEALIGLIGQAAKTWVYCSLASGVTSVTSDRWQKTDSVAILNIWTNSFHLQIPTNIT